MGYADSLQAIHEAKVVAILRGDYQGKWLDIAKALLDGGLNIMEITLNSPGAIDAIKEISGQMGGQMRIGAGTVVTADEVDQAFAAGAQFVIAPNTDADVIKRALFHDLLAIPGAYSPTEVMLAHKLGGGMVKLFPSMPIGPAYIKALRGPMPQIPIMCTGGITPENAAEFLKAGANAVGFTGALVTDDVHQFGGMARLRERAERSVAAIQGLQRA